MPNWCLNDLRVTAPSGVFSPQVFWAVAGPPPPLADTPARQVVDSLRGDEPDEPLTFETLAPTPPELLSGKGWYEWRVENWGTKWDAGDVDIVDEGPDGIRLRFMTAWAPPVAWVKLLGEALPDDYAVELIFVEPAEDLVGSTTFADGSFAVQSAVSGREREFLSQWDLEDLWWEDETDVDGDSV
jgi:hypothetical protein